MSKTSKRKMAWKLTLLIMAIIISSAAAFRPTDEGSSKFYTIKEGGELDMECPFKTATFPQTNITTNRDCLWARGDSSLELFSIKGSDFFQYTIKMMQPSLMEHYEIKSDNSSSHLVIRAANMDDENIGHPDKYKCTILAVMTSKTFQVTIVRDLECSHDGFPWVVNRMVNISCKISRSVNHYGQVKFLLFASDKKVGQYVDSFAKKNPWNKSYGFFKFRPKKNDIDKNITVQIEISQAPNLVYVVTPRLQLTHGVNVTCSSEIRRYLIDSDFWSPPSCNVSVAVIPEIEDLSFNWNIKGKKVEPEPVEADCLANSSACRITIPPDGCKYLEPPVAKVHFNVLDFGVATISESFDVTVYREPTINCSFKGPRFLDLSRESQKLVVICHIKSVPVIPYKNVSWFYPKDIVRISADGQDGSIGEGFFGPTVVKAEFEAISLSEDKFKSKFNMEQKLETRRDLEASFQGEREEEIREFALASITTTTDFPSTTLTTKSTTTTMTWLNESMSEEDSSILPSFDSQETTKARNEINSTSVSVENEFSTIDEGAKTKDLFLPSEISTSTMITSDLRSTTNQLPNANTTNGSLSKSGYPRDDDNLNNNDNNADDSNVVQEKIPDTVSSTSTTTSTPTTTSTITTSTTMTSTSTTTPTTTSTTKPTTTSTTKPTTRPSTTTTPTPTTTTTTTIPTTTTTTSITMPTTTTTIATTTKTTTTKTTEINNLNTVGEEIKTLPPSSNAEKVERKEEIEKESEIDHLATEVPTTIERKKRSPSFNNRVLLSLNFNYNAHCYNREFVRKWEQPLVFWGKLSCDHEVEVTRIPFTVRCYFLSFPPLKPDHVHILTLTSLEAATMEGQVTVYGTEEFSDGFDLHITYLSWHQALRKSAMIIVVDNEVNRFEVMVRLLMRTKSLPRKLITKPTTKATTAATTPAIGPMSEIEYGELFNEKEQKNLSEKFWGEDWKPRHPKKEEFGGRLAAEEAANTGKATGVVKSERGNWVVPLIVVCAFVLCFTAAGVYYVVSHRHRANNYQVEGDSYAETPAPVVESVTTSV